MLDIALMVLNGFNPIAFAVAVVLIACLGLFATLTVELDDRRVKIRFGIGLIRKSFHYEAIESFQQVRNPWYYGWGIRFIGYGWLFNVSGLQAVEFKMKHGRRYRIGTDDPAGLIQALEARIALERTT